MLFLLDIYRLFFGDNRFNNDPLNIISIRIIKHRSNLKNQVAAITVLDGIISDSLYANKIEEDSDYATIIKALFEDDDRRKLDPYIYDTFQCFIDHKEKMEINMMTLDTYIKDKKLLQLITNDLLEVKNKLDISLWINNNDNKDNLIKRRLFEIFHNVKEIRIDVGLNRYPFSLLSLLSNIQNTSIQKVTIVSYNSFKPLSSSSYFDGIKEEYKTRQFGMNIAGSSLIIQSHTKFDTVM